MSKENNLNEKNLQATGKSLVFETLGSITEMQKTTDSKTGLMKLTGTFGVCGVVNNNNRIYEKNNYAAMVKELQKEITEKGGIPGELEHPQTMNISLENVSHKITDISIDENGLVTGTIELLNTPKGKIAQSIVEGGLPLFVSSRATGEIKESKVTLSKIYTYDLVGTPGFSQARVHLNENQNVTELNESIYVITEKDNSKNNNMKKTKTRKKKVNEGRFSKGWFDPVEKKLARVRFSKNDKYEKEIDDLNREEPFFTLDYNPVDCEMEFGRFKKPNDTLKVIIKTKLNIDGEEVDVLDEIGDEFLFDSSTYLIRGSHHPSNVYFTLDDPKRKCTVLVINAEEEDEEDGAVYWADKNIDLEFDNPNHEDLVRDGIVDPWPEDEDYYDFDDDDEDYNENKKTSKKDMYTKQEVENLIQESIKKSEKNQENYILDVLAPTLESWLTKDYAKVLEAWLEDEYSKKIQQITEDYVINEAAPVIEKWIVEQYSGELEKWMVENVVGVLDKYINEQLTPGILEQAKKEINESLKSNKESKIGNIKEMLTMLEGLGGNNNQSNKGGQFKPATNAINENGSNPSLTEPIYIQNMPDHIRPKYINLSESLKEIIATKAKLFNFNVPGSIERFWSDFDNMVEKYSGSKGNNNGNLNENYQGKYNSGLTLNNYENTIREQLRQRFAKYNK